MGALDDSNDSILNYLQRQKLKHLNSDASTLSI